VQKKNIWIILTITAAVIMVCCTAGIGLVAWQIFTMPTTDDLTSDTEAIITPPPPPTANHNPSPTRRPPTPAPSPTTPADTTETGIEASPLPLTTEQILLQTIIPERDQRLLAMRLKHNGEEIPQVVYDVPPNYQKNDTDTFWVTDNEQTPPRQFQVEADLQYITPHSYWWVQKDFNVKAQSLKLSAEQFEENTYPTNRAFFGSEWSPGVDNDERVHIFMGDVPGVAGYYSASNEYSRLAEPYSNQREMFFINLNAINPGNEYFDSVLAHEFQHMIHWHQDRNEDTWVNEGLSELATYLNGFGGSGFSGTFIAAPDTQLNSWADSPNQSLAHYGGSFLFMTYFLQQYGEELTQQVVAHPQNGIAGFNTVLTEAGLAEQFDDIFADFLITNYVQDTSVADGRWGYEDLNLRTVDIADYFDKYPVEQQAQVTQYGADYYELTGDGPLEIQFSGDTQVKVIDNNAHSGNYQWYSHRGDDSNSRLTRAVDLSAVSVATLNYWTWYDIEKDWDYAYVEISTDGGRTWHILQTPHSATDNPSGNAYGPGYTGPSGGDEPTWIEESIDLSAFTGQEVLIRFEYVTDDAVNRPGWTIDDISIPEIDFFDDGESGPGDWTTEGFARIDNRLAQKFLVQVIEIGPDITVTPLMLTDDNTGSLTIAGLGDGIEQAILLVSGLTPITTEPAHYTFQIFED
jgi:immune inhibitor A